MLNTGITSTISLRTRGPIQYSSNNYSHCSNGSRPFAYSSSIPCCSCCCSSMYNTVPLCPSYGCSLYGLRQSSLIQWSPYRRLISGSFDYYSRLPVSDVDEICYCERVCNVREKKVGRRKGGLRKCLEYEERGGRYEHGSVDEAEVLLSLLTEDVGEECLLVRKGTRRLVRKPPVEKRENGEVCDECGSKKKKVEEAVSGCDSRSEHGLVFSSRKNDNKWRKEIIRREEEEEGLLWEENRKVRLREERGCALLKNRTERERDAILRKGRLREEHRSALLKNRTERELEEREALLRKASRKAEENQESDSIIRKENWNVRSRTEEEDRLKVRRDGSSCSSYYSLSSNGDSENDHEEGRILEDLSSEQRNSRNDEIVFRDTKEEDQRREDYREDHGLSLTNKTSSKEFHTGQNIFESDFRKKSEKRLADTAMDEMESRKEISVKESKSSTARESNYKKSSDYSVSYDDRKVKSARSMEHDEERKQQLARTSDEVSKQSETMLKYKQSVERQDFRSSDVRKFSGSQKVYSGKDDMPAKVASSNRETVGEHQAVVGLGTREDDYQRNLRKVDKISEVQDIDIRKTSISQQRFETNVRVEDYSINNRSSTNDAKKQHQQYDQVSGFVESTGNTQQLTRKDGKSGSKKQTGKFSKQEGNVNLVSSSSLESKEPGSLIPSKITKSVNSQNESDELNKVLITHSGNSGALMVEDRNKTKTETTLRPPPNLPEAGMLSPGLKVGATDDDAITSASQLEESSAQYVGEFVKQVRNEILSSKIQREKETYETKVSHGESSGDSHLKEHDLGSNNQQIGTRGPSDEMWNVDEPSVLESSKPEAEDSTSKAENAIVKRTGRSLWNIIGDIVLLRWSPHSGSHSSGTKIGGRSSPNQSTSTGTWFSGHEAEENEEATEQKEERIIRQSLPSSHQEAKTHSRVEESPSSSDLEAHLRRAGTDATSSSVIRESVSPLTRPSLPSSREISEERTSFGTVDDSSNPLPAPRLRRSPAVQGDLQEGEAYAFDSGMSEQLNSGSIEQTGSTVNEGELKPRKLQRKDQVVRDRFDEWAEAYRLESEQRKIDEMFMREALLEAQRAADNWEVPVGTVLVHNGEIIARGCNLVEELRDSTAHAEIMCIREASKMLRTWRLSETTLYVTLEPCPMCAGAILQARIDTVVWGAPNKLLGADGSWIRLFPGDGGNGTEQTDKPPAPVHPFHPKITIRRGVMASECADAMQQFFKRRRKKDKNAEAPTTPPSCLPIPNRPSKFLTRMHDAFHLMLCL